MDGLDLSLELPLGSSQGRSLGGSLVGLVTGIGSLVLGLLAGTLSGLVGNEEFFLLALEDGGSLLGVEELLSDVVAVPLLLFNLHLELADLFLVALQVLLGVGVGLVGVVKSDLKLVDVSLELLLDT